MKKISIANQKGGVGKTTAAVTLTSTLRRRGYRVLLVDLDSQRNATRWALGGKVPPSDHPTMFDVLVADEDEDISIRDTIIQSKFGFRLAPADEMFSAIDAKLTSHAGQRQLLPARLSEYEESFQNGSETPPEVCVIDCPATYGTLVLQAISASDGIIVPVEVEGMSMQGLGQFLSTVKRLRKNTGNRSLSILGILANNFDIRRGITKDGLADLREEFPDLLFETEIPMRTQIMEASAHGQSVHEYASGDEPEFFEDLTDEVIERAKL